MWAVGWAHLSKGIILLQRVIAVALAVLGLGVTGAAIASGTVWAPSSVVTASAAVGDPTTLAVTAPGVLELFDGPVAITATRADGGPVTVAIGRENDVVGWVGPDAHARVSGLSSWTALGTTLVPGTTKSVKDGSGLIGPDPSDSDMWLVSAQGEGTAALTWDGAKGRTILLVANTGDDAPAPTLTLSWDREVSTPWMIPGIVVGVLTLLLGLVLLMRATRLTQAHPGRLGTARASEVEPATRGARTRPTPRDRFVEVAEPAPSREADATKAHMPEPAATSAPETGPVTLVVVPSLSSTGTASASNAPSTPDEATRAAGSTPRFGEGNAAPMSRRELRELAAREAAEAARARKAPRSRRRQGDDEPAPTHAPRTGTTPRTLLRTLTGAQPIVPAPAPKPDELAPDAGGSNRAYAWRKAWGFDGLATGTPDDAADSPENDSQETP